MSIQRTSDDRETPSASSERLICVQFTFSGKLFKQNTLIKA